MIIVGYQGVGKSTLAKKGKGYIDLESSNFFIDGKRDEEWYKPYCNIADNLSSQGYSVFVSSHKVVRESLSRSSALKVIVRPSLCLKGPWIEKLRVRYEKTGLTKDYNAYMNAEYRYAENIRELAEDQGFGQIVISSMSYSLHDEVERYIRAHRITRVSEIGT